MPEASPRSVTGSSAGSPAAAGPPPASRQVSQSCGSSTRRTRRALSGSFSASQRSLVTVNDIVGTLPVRAAHSAAPPSSSTSARACGADFTLFHSMAGLITSPPSSSTTIPCCCAATPTASARSSRSRPAEVSASHQRSG